MNDRDWGTVAPPVLCPSSPLSPSPPAPAPILLPWGNPWRGGARYYRYPRAATSRALLMNRSNEEVSTSRINRQAAFMAVFDAPAKERT